MSRERAQSASSDSRAAAAMRARTPSWLTSSPPSGPTTAPSRRTIIAVGSLDDLFELGGDEEHGDPLARELADERLDLRLGADVDPARRIVEDEDPRVEAQHPGEQHLLLIATRQLADLLVAGSRP